MRNIFTRGGVYVCVSKKVYARIRMYVSATHVQSENTMHVRVTSVCVVCEKTIHI
jgi:hypothetical protein